MALQPTWSTYLKAFGIGALLAVVGIVAYLQFGTAASQETIAAPARAATAEDATDALTPERLAAITVYKSPTCGCCVEWVDHLRENGFTVKTTDLADMQQIKNRFGVPQALSSCHTGIIDGYVIEGHVPADDIKNLLATKPDVTGLTVPGMPVGSPGMEQGDRVDPYDVLAFNQEGEISVFAQYRPE